MAAIMGGGKEERQPRKDYYWNQGGWDGNTWGGVHRICFVFSDTLEVGGGLGAGDVEGVINDIDTGAQLAAFLPTQCFAGIVCVAN